MTREVVSNVANATLFNDGTILVKNVRLSYPHLAKPYESTGDDGNTKSSYSIVGMMPKSTHGAAKDLIKKCIQQLETDNDVKIKNEHWFLKNGDDDGKPEYEGHFIVKASEKRRPTVRDRKGTVMTESEIEQCFYGGCWANILIRPWYFNGKAKNGKTYPKRALSNLIAVQFVRDDDSFGEGRIDDEGVFESVDDDSSIGGDDDL